MNRQKENRRVLSIIVIALLMVFVIGILFLSSDKRTETVVTLAPDGCIVSGAGAVIQKNTVVISRSGTYVISGILEEGQIYVDAGKEDQVELILNGVDIFNDEDAAIYIENAKHTTIVLAQNTQNTLKSGVAAANKNEKSDDEDTGGAVIYAKDDLSITGEGFLQVEGYIHNGIHTKNHLLIEGGNIEVEAINCAVKGKDSVNITGGSLVITDSVEGIEANQITIDGGMIDITASDDGINANGGADKKKKNPSDNVVEKMPNLIITGGEVRVNAQGDGLDSNGNLIIEGGNIIIDGPTRNDEGALDYGTENGGICTISGGTVLAIGSAGMAVTFDENSEQCSFCYILKPAYEAGSEILICDADGKQLYRHTALKKGASIVFSSPELTKGKSCMLTVGETCVEIVP